ncbi:DUF4349 domain-containing protein [Halococcus hamelinensis]|uniref:DUF4349 domain-containing protein n=1 Tax=Halococcus hamelinensis TaxID=332168 RepID=UPI000A656E02|nr:DUF4349 domain-containing protein [Halococcus hamelinensis]
MPSHIRTVAVVVMLCMVVLAGCSGSGGAGGNQASGASGGGGNASAGMGGGGASAGGGGAGEAQRAQQVPQAIIKTGRVQLGVENFSVAQRNLTRATREAGGYVSASSESTYTESGENVTRGELVLRVPSRNFTGLFSQVKSLGTVQNADSNTTDVSGKLVDLRARLNNSRAQRDRLRALYDNASDTEATLAVQKRLSTVQSRIERLEGRLSSLNDRVAYSTITVTYAESSPSAPPEQWYDVGVVSALVSSMEGVVTAIRALVVGFAYAAPYLLVFGVPLALVGYLVLRRRNAL